jgi:hypothetical protein
LNKKACKKGDKVLLYTSMFKTFRKGKLQSKWDGPYIVHSVLSNGAVNIMYMKGDQFMVNGQRPEVYFELDIVPLHHIDVFIMEDEHYVNSPSFIFLEFLMKFYQDNFFTWARNSKIVGHAKN